MIISSRMALMMRQSRMPRNQLPTLRCIIVVSVMICDHCGHRHGNNVWSRKAEAKHGWLSYIALVEMLHCTAISMHSRPWRFDHTCTDVHETKNAGKVPQKREGKNNLSAQELRDSDAIHDAQAPTSDRRAPRTHQTRCPTAVSTPMNSGSHERNEPCAVVMWRRHSETVRAPETQTRFPAERPHWRAVVRTMAVRGSPRGQGLAVLQDRTRERSSRM